MMIKIKKLISMFLIVCLALVMSSCTKDGTQSQPPIETPTPSQSERTTPTVPPIALSPKATPQTPTPTPEPFPGKIGIVTDRNADYNFGYYAAINISQKYSAKKIVHGGWPEGMMPEKDNLLLCIKGISEDEGIKTIITMPTLASFSEIISELKEKRADIFYICVNPQDALADITKQADIVLQMDWLSMVLIEVQQARKLGAKVLVYYSFPRHMSQVSLSSGRDLVKLECEKLDIKFVDATIPDPYEGGSSVTDALGMFRFTCN